MRILIVKLSSLGDVVHAMASVQDIRQAFPYTQIDWVVERGFAPLVLRCKGVHRVIPCELRRWRKAMFSPETRQAWQLFKTDLRQDAYDAVIDLQGLAKSALVSRLARLAPGGKRYGMANQTEGSSFEAPARWVADVAITLPAHSHAVTRSRQLCAQALGYTLPFYMSFGLLALMDKGLPDTKKIAFRTGLNGIVALVHGTSRADKEWPLDHWRALGERLNAAGYIVALPHGSATEEAVCHQIAAGLAHTQVWPRLALDALTDSLANCTGVIGVDSGLSHIAVALDLAHVQIYNFDTAWRTGPLAEQPANAGGSAARQVSVFEPPTPSVDSVWQAWEAVAAAAAQARPPTTYFRASGLGSL
ncbi:lipopolysaccharide heptosyltransferase I [Rhodoferax sp. 4810]|nr:lipopolysaccharide heptosyltransferase I [Rhodoferax jenense]